MKKLLIFIFITLIFISCKTEGTERASGTGIYGNVYVKEMIYKNHSYLEFKDVSTYGQGWVHNPDCKCFKDSI